MLWIEFIQLHPLMAKPFAIRPKPRKLVFEFLIRNNEEHRVEATDDGMVEVSFDETPPEGESFYYLRVVQDNGEVLIEPAVADVRELRGLLHRPGRRPVSVALLPRTRPPK